MVKDESVANGQSEGVFDGEIRMSLSSQTTHADAFRSCFSIAKAQFGVFEVKSGECSYGARLLIRSAALSGVGLISARSRLSCAIRSVILRTLRSMLWATFLRV